MATINQVVIGTSTYDLEVKATNIDGTLAIAKGGTGTTTNPSLLVNLASTTAATVFQASPRPGITGVLGIAHGGTGATTSSGVRAAIGVHQIHYGTTTPAATLGEVGDIYVLYTQ